ncbi:MAG: hypothetical protein P1U57_15045, partial [Oleibacter sp.]|nr:hypothetical protein [Thalassolituus sp.]
MSQSVNNENALGKMISDDLYWSIEEMKAKEAGKQFLLSVAEFLPVYSPALRQVYSDYETFFTKQAVVVLPEPINFTATFSHIPEVAVRRTGILIFPDSNGISMNIRLQNRRTATLSLPEGLKAIKKNLRVPFLPVIKRGDLRDFNQLRPCLQLNALVPHMAP